MSNVADYINSNDKITQGLQVALRPETNGPVMITPIAAVAAGAGVVATARVGQHVARYVAHRDH
ncbi:hypothetical protein [Streptomyces sp. NRRL B-1347]|uniref:hypothetical protein n=1 Tax=Streptomyces sp. NRRL B-1347 TaxID=1476877 RepID=UPI00131B0E7C|nr:hypothetical protein [Streptomyces sp. NRRL B-1347]